MPTTTWANEAGCLGTPPYLWDNEVNPSQLRRICDACPVKAACLAEAVRCGDTYGFRAGTTGQERVRIIAAHRLGLPEAEIPAAAADAVAALRAADCRRHSKGALRAAVAALAAAGCSKQEIVQITRRRPSDIKTYLEKTHGATQ